MFDHECPTAGRLARGDVGVSHPTEQSDSASANRPLAAIILAAGHGKRMNSDLPKVVHPVAGKPMVWWVVQTVRQAGASRIVLIVGHGADRVQNVFKGDDSDIDFAVQHEQLGTGHATACAEPLLRDFEGNIVVLAGDGPLIRVETVLAMLQHHGKSGAKATLATSVIDDPTGYGRIVRNADGRFQAIIEHKNAADDERQICEIYPSYACFDAKSLFDLLSHLGPDPVTGEYYLTEIPGMLRTRGERVELVEAVPPEDVLSINTPTQLAEVDAILSQRLQLSEARTGS